MKKILILSYGIFVAGFFLKFFHIHYNAVVMISALLIMLIMNFVLAFSKDQDQAVTYTGFAVTSWLALLLFTVKFFPFSKIVLAVSAALTIIAVILSLKKRRLYRFPLLLTCLAVALVFYTMATDRKYYWLNIKWNYEIDTDYFSWDKYSWHLYRNEKFAEALAASEHAVQLAEKANDAEAFQLIKEHQSGIKDKSWERYR